MWSWTKRVFDIDNVLPCLSSCSGHFTYGSAQRISWTLHMHWHLVTERSLELREAVEVTGQTNCPGQRSQAERGIRVDSDEPESRGQPWWRHMWNWGRRRAVWRSMSLRWKVGNWTGKGHAFYGARCAVGFERIYNPLSGSVVSSGNVQFVLVF